MPDTSSYGYDPNAAQGFVPGSDPNDPYGWLTGGNGMYDPFGTGGALGGATDYSNLFGGNTDWMNLGQDQLGYYGA